MKNAVLIAVVALVGSFLVNGAIAKDRGGEKSTAHVKLLKAEFRKATRQAPLKLPDITGLTKKLLRSERTVVQQQTVASAKVLNFWEHRGKWIRATRHDKCWEVPWQRSCTIARASYRLHLTLAVAGKQQLRRMLPETNDWMTAVRIVQRVYPGTAARLIQITDHEGGRGDWVWNNGVCGHHCVWRGYHVGYDGTGDVVGGWLQFRYSTFAPYWRGMIKDLRKRGFILPDLGWARPYVVKGASTGYGPWLSPLGQALTGAYMHYHGRQGSHWNF